MILERCEVRREQAKANSQKAKAVLELYNQKKERIQSVTHSQYVRKDP